jgi:hypothetical protein
MTAAEPVFVGVRHHSPACARLVAWTIEDVRPALVLVEGPADMNGRFGELLLPHELPIAVFSYLREGETTRASWAPFCEHSPEWAALISASKVGAETRFIDLPAWHPAFGEVRNRFSDRADRWGRVAARLCARFGVADTDALWEHLFEQPLAEADLARRLAAYFEELREAEPVPERDAEREAFMAQCVAAACAEGKPVVVVCGGFHAPALARAWRACGAVGWPATPALPEGTRAGSYLVPYSFRRLDSFTGYESGMPSPAYQDAVFREGPEGAGEHMLQRTVERLRGRKQAVSAADVIAVATMARGLSRLRGHQSPMRVDLLDGIAAGLVKEALDAPLPWTYRGPLRARTDPVLVEVVAAFSGDRVGRLAPGTPQPPLLLEVRSELRLHDLEPSTAGRTVALDLGQPADVVRSRILHRLRVLGSPGFGRQSGPSWATDGEIGETWLLRFVLEADGALIEAAAYGATLEAAAAARVEEELVACGGRLAELAALLGDAVFVGIDTIADKLLDVVARQVGAEPSFAALGGALARLLGLWRDDTLLGAARSVALGKVLAAAFARGLWLAEGLLGPDQPADSAQVEGVVALRDTLRHGEGAISVDRIHAHDVMRRRTQDEGAPPAVRGAALGFLWSTGSSEDATGEAVAAVRRAALPARLGDFLVGLFALAREELRQAEALIGALDDTVTGMSEPDFLVALPALRLAFSYFPPYEREEIGAAVLRRHGRDPAGASALVRERVDPGAFAAGRALEAGLTRMLGRFGLSGEDE